MARKANNLPLESWAEAVGVGTEEVKTAWDDLQRRGLAAVKGGNSVVSPLAMRRANSPVQRRLAAHLAGFLLTENSFIVQKADDPPGSPSILNTRITVEQIAHYFKEGWDVTDIQRDLPQLLREEIEAAIQSYLNHREELERALRRKGIAPRRADDQGGQVSGHIGEVSPQPNLGCSLGLDPGKDFCQVGTVRFQLIGSAQQKKLVKGGRDQLEEPPGTKFFPESEEVRVFPRSSHRREECRLCLIGQSILFAANADSSPSSIRSINLT